MGPLSASGNPHVIARTLPCATTSARLDDRLGTENIASAGSAQRLFNIADTMHRVCGNPGERHFGCQRTLYHLNGQGRLGGED
ncbi:hypothetical protein SAMN05518801_10859 [Novosphingobium sp. CF614]|nr:hypothetical protein SAMN05518801_10859 [Novosphingobium sp. CF614]